MSIRVLGLLPARGGSKGIPGKNLRLLLGKPLIAWSAQALRDATKPARKICSTDDTSIANAAQNNGLEVPWLRPASLSKDDTLVVDVIIHALEQLEAEGDEQYTHVVLVQATSPTVTAHDVDKAIDLAIEGDADTVITGFLAGQRHPATMYRLGSEGQVDWLFEESERMVRRQDMAPIYIRTGLVYVIKAELIKEKRTLYGERILALTVPEERAITIDEEADFKLAEHMMKDRKDD